MEQDQDIQQYIHVNCSENVDCVHMKINITQTLCIVLFIWLLYRISSSSVVQYNSSMLSGYYDTTTKSQC